MFCAGNNTERMRMARVECVNEIIVDLYAGESEREGVGSRMRQAFV